MTDEIVAESGSEELPETPEAPPSDAGEPAKPSLSDTINAALDSAGIEERPLGKPKAEKPEAKPKEEPVDKSKASEDAPPKRGAKPKQESQPQPAAAQAPEHWPQAQREAFAKLPPEGQRILTEAIKNFEAGFTKKSTEQADDVKLAQAIRTSISGDQRSLLQQSGMSEAQGIQRLLQLDQYARSDPAGYVRWIMQETGLDPRQVFPNLTGPAQPGQQQPQRQPTQPQPQSRPQADPNNPLAQEVARLRNWIANEEKNRQDSESQQVNNIYGQFRDQKDEAGNPVNIYLSRVEDRLVEILRTPSMLAIPDKAERLRKAYEQAIWADPDIRAELQAKEREKAEAERKAQAEAEKAKRAKPPIQGQPRAADGRYIPSKLSDVVSQAMDQAGI